MLYKCIHMHIYMKSSRFGAVFRHTRATQMFIDPCGPQHVYAPCGHIFSLFSMFFLSYFFPKDFITPHIINNRMTDFPNHHSIMYDFTPLYSPVICKDFFPLVYMYKLSRYYAVFNID